MNDEPPIPLVILDSKGVSLFQTRVYPDIPDYKMFSGRLQRNPVGSLPKTSDNLGDIQF